MTTSEMALSITGMLWLDAVHTTSIAEAKYVLERVSALVKKYPAHTLSIAHVMYAPAFEQKFKFIDELNDLIQETNCSNGRPVYRLSNIGARGVGRGYLTYILGVARKILRECEESHPPAPSF